MPRPDIDVPALARLSRIDVSPDMATRLGEQLPRIIDYVGQLQDVTAEVVPVVPEAMPLREDAVTMASKDVRQQILAQAPDRQDDFWKVKAVF